MVLFLRLLALKTLFLRHAQFSVPNFCIIRVQQLNNHPRVSGGELLRTTFLPIFVPSGVLPWRHVT